MQSTKYTSNNILLPYSYCFAYSKMAHQGQEIPPLSLPIHTTKIVELPQKIVMNIKTVAGGNSCCCQLQITCIQSENIPTGSSSRLYFCVPVTVYSNMNRIGTQITFQLIIPKLGDVVPALRSCCPEVPHWFACSISSVLVSRHFATNIIREVVAFS